jgi:hypothetical protein
MASVAPFGGYLLWIVLRAGRVAEVTGTLKFCDDQHTFTGNTH